MDLETFRKKCNHKSAQYFSEHNCIWRIRCNRHLFHVAIHELEFERFCANPDFQNENVIVLNCSRMFKGGHVHLTVGCKEGYRITSSWGIRVVEPFKIDQWFSVPGHFISQENHDKVCRVELWIPSLQNGCMDRILHSLFHLEDRKKLPLPNSLSEKLFERCRTHFKLPIQNTWRCYTRSLELFAQVDHVFEKSYVAWLQKKIRFPIWGEKNFVSVDFRSRDNGGSVRRCGYCLNSKNAVRRYRTIWIHNPWHDHLCSRKIIQDPRNWCEVCKQVPLFQILDDCDLKKQYKVNKYSKIIIGLKKNENAIVETDIVLCYNP